VGITGDHQEEIVNTRKKIVLAATAALAIGGVVGGTALASATPPAPANTHAVPAAPAAQDTPEPGDTPDAKDAPEPGDTQDAKEKPEAGEVAGQDKDNVQHEGTGDEGNHADEAPAAAPK
jgi:hypothetical protein